MKNKNNNNTKALTKMIIEQFEAYQKIIQSIDEFFSLLSDKVATFQGKTLVQPPENT